MMKLFCVLFVGLIALQSSASVSIPFTDGNISKYGRYVDDSTGTDLTWEGSWMRFKVSGTTKIKLNVQVNILGGGNPPAAGLLKCYIDNGPGTGICVTPASDQDQTVTLVSGLTAGEHTVVIQRGEYYPHSSLVSSEYVKIKNIILDDGGSLSAWSQTGTHAMLFLGDSWAGDENSVTRFMDLKKWNIWTVGFGGFQASTMNNCYPYKALKIPQTDPAQQLCVIQFGVNDRLGGVTTATFKSAVQGIMKKVAADHSGIKFFLIQVPANGKNDYDMYGTVLSELAKENANSYYISTASIADSLKWSDKAHLSFASRKDVYCPYLDSQISSCLSRKPDADQQ